VIPFEFESGGLQVMEVPEVLASDERGFAPASGECSGEPESLRLGQSQVKR
jgi:hypothetical protein